MIYWTCDRIKLLHHSCNRLSPVNCDSRASAYFLRYRTTVGHRNGIARESHSYEQTNALTDECGAGRRQSGSDPETGFWEMPDPCQVVVERFCVQSVNVSRYAATRDPLRFRSG
jgi:hypothetical protein